MTDSNRHVYVDTKYVHAFIFPNPRRHIDEEQFAKEQFNRALHSHDNFILKIPQVVMGETVNNIHRSDLNEMDKDDIIRNLLHILSEPKVDISPASLECIKLTNSLLTKDSNLDNNDTLIVSQALCDPLSTHLIMDDGKIINSGAIRKANQELKDDGMRSSLLKITSEF